jgi:hypothetical protein
VWLGGVLTLLVFLPNLVWQWTHDWPSLDFVALARETVHARLSRGLIFGELALASHPLNALSVLLGLDFFLRAGDGRRYRAVGWVVLGVLGVLLVLGGKSYYAAPLLPPLLAAGCVRLEGLLRAARHPRACAGAAFALLLLGGAALAPMTVPLLPLPSLLRYTELLRQTEHRNDGGGMQRLPLYFADQFGWPELVAEVARVYRDLPLEEQARTGILAWNYGEAGAIDLLGREYGLPRAISGDFNYYLWGPGDPPPDAVITLGLQPERVRAFCPDAELRAVHRHPYALSFEQEVPICLCRRLDLVEIWPSLRAGF